MLTGPNSSAVLEGLKTIAGVHPDGVEGVTLPLLFHTLPEAAPAQDDVDGRDAYRSILAALTDLCTLPALFETLVVRVSTKLDLLSSTAASAHSHAREPTVAYAWDLLNTLQKVINIKLEAKHVDLPKYYSQVMPRLFGMAAAAAAPRDDTVIPLFRDRRLISIVAVIGEALFWELSAVKQAPAFDAMTAAFEGGDMSAIVHNGSSSSSSGSPLRADATEAEQDLVAFYSAIVRGLKADTAIPNSASPDFTAARTFPAAKTEWALHAAQDEFQLRLVLDMLCAFVNKRAPTKELGDSVAQLLERLWTGHIQVASEGSGELRRRAMLVYLHIVKGLALVRDELAYSSVQKLVELLGSGPADAAFVHEAACGFGVLAEGGGKGKGKGRGAHLTTKVSRSVDHCMLLCCAVLTFAKLLHAQKLWNFVLPQLIAGDKEAQTVARGIGSGSGAARTDVYLVAFASLLPLVPATLFLSDLPTVSTIGDQAQTHHRAAERSSTVQLHVHG